MSTIGLHSILRSDQLRKRHFYWQNNPSIRRQFPNWLDFEKDAREKDEMAALDGIRSPFPQQENRPVVDRTYQLVAGQDLEDSWKFPRY